MSVVLTKPESCPKISYFIWKPFLGSKYLKVTFLLDKLPYSIVILNCGHDN